MRYIILAVAFMLTSISAFAAPIASTTSASVDGGHVMLAKGKHAKKPKA